MTTPQLPSEADCIVFEKPGQVQTGRHPLPACGPDEMLLETLYSMISPGTELRMLDGHYGAEGNFPYIPGYNSISRVLSLGSEVKGWRVGDLVSAINAKPNPKIKGMYGAHASHQVTTTTADQRPVLLPAGANPLDYVITELASISYRGMTAARPRANESVVVIGQGMIGALSAAWFVASGCRVCVIDLEESRLARATGFGAALGIKGDAPDIVDRVRLFSSGGADIVVEASGSTGGIELAFALARCKPQNNAPTYMREPIHFYNGEWPRLVFQANYLDRVPFDPHAAFAGEGAIFLAPSDRGLEDRTRVVESLRSQRIEASRFVDKVLPFTEAADAYQGLKSRKYFSVVFDWTQGRKTTP
jgi:2-desacetyl-2-hydroxyethyl bacteriochlorophyllide A dehydrogenase